MFLAVVTMVRDGFLTPCKSSLRSRGSSVLPRRRRQLVACLSHVILLLLVVLLTGCGIAIADDSGKLLAQRYRLGRTEARCRCNSYTLNGGHMSHDSEWR